MCWIDCDPPVLGYARGDCVVAGNVGPHAETLRLPSAGWNVEFATNGGSFERVEGQVRLGAEQALILTRTGDGA